MTSRDEKLKQSFDYISRNLHVTFDQVPETLRELWYSDPDSDDEEQRGFAWTVFMYAILCTKKSQGVESFQMTEERLSELFQNWQVCLAVAELNAVTEFQVAPFKIFDIENLEKIKVQITPRN